MKKSILTFTLTVSLSLFCLTGMAGSQYFFALYNAKTLALLPLAALDQKPTGLYGIDDAITITKAIVKQLNLEKNIDPKTVTISFSGSDTHLMQLVKIEDTWELSNPENELSILKLLSDMGSFRNMVFNFTGPEISEQQLEQIKAELPKESFQKHQEDSTNNNSNNKENWTLLYSDRQWEFQFYSLVDKKVVA